jgi:hypothetical protein
MVEQPTPPLLRRVAWFFGLWTSGVLALGIVTYALRAVLF